MSQLDLGLIGNCQVSALIDKNANMVWASMPRLDSSSVFGQLLSDENAGHWSICPSDSKHTTKQSYIKNTNVLKTEFVMDNGDEFHVIDFAPRFRAKGSYVRPPMFCRIIKNVQGFPKIKICLQPRPSYGSEVPKQRLRTEGFSYETKDEVFFLRTNAPLTYVQEVREFILHETLYFVFSYDIPFDFPLRDTVEDYFQDTTAYWRTWVKHCNIPFDYQEEVIRSALVLKLHIFDDTGAIMAATTTSIPESPDGGRCWDYRFCWLRDSYFVINALNQLGQFEEMESFIEFLHNIASLHEDDSLQPLYAISGESLLIEKELPWLKGFKGIGPVRVGNTAFTHAQHDVYGEMILALQPIFFDQRLYTMNRERIFKRVKKIVNRAVRDFNYPDSGIWEYRSEPRHYLFSKVMCWVAVDRGIRIAKVSGETALAEEWETYLNIMREQIETKGWNKDLGIFGQTYGDSISDASNLLMVTFKFLKPDDLKFKSMVEYYQKDLAINDFVFRYKNKDDFGLPRHAFTICSFWMIDALAQIGKTEEARALFHKVLGCTNHLGLLSEDIDPKSGELWGNFPQTYSHVGIINSAFRLSRKWEDAL